MRNNGGLLLFIEASSRAVVLCQSSRVLTVFNGSTQRVRMVLNMLNNVNRRVASCLNGHLTVSSYQGIINEVVRLRSNSLLLRDELGPLGSHVRRLKGVLRSRVG